MAAGAPPVSQETVDGWFRQDILTHEGYALDLSPSLRNQSEARQTAITSFVYNLGPTRYQNSTLRKRINTSNWAEAQVEIQKWVFGGGKKLPGLVLRRAAEAALLG